MSIHDGHRTRIREQFINAGFENRAEHEVLEFLLFYCIPRQDTNALAHRLIDHFGSLEQVFRAPVEELIEIKGVGERTAAYITMLSEFAKYYTLHKFKDRRSMSTPAECFEYLRAFYSRSTKETVCILSLDAKCGLLKCSTISDGDINSAAISTSNIVRTAILNNASMVILSHNHTSNSARPSTADLMVTEGVARALAAVNITLIDHIIVAQNDVLSFKQSNEYRRHLNPVQNEGDYYASNLLPR